MLPLTDEQAMWRLQTQADETAFTRLMQRWQLPIRRLCARMTGDPHIGEDLAQETFARVYLHRDQFQAGTRFSTWLWRIALNLCHDSHRRGQARPESALAPDEDSESSLSSELSVEPGPDEVAAQQDDAFLIAHALRRLPETHREVVVLRHYENLKFREIAEVLDIPEGTVKSRMADALDQLSRHLQPVLARQTPSPTPDAL